MYQIIIVEIEYLMGIEFLLILGEYNLLLFYDILINWEIGEVVNVYEFFENIFVDKLDDFIGQNEIWLIILDDWEDVFIVGILLNFKGWDRGIEWVMIFNFKLEIVLFDGWMLVDNIGCVDFSGIFQFGELRCI